MSPVVLCDVEPVVSDSLVDAFAALRGADLAALDVSGLQAAAGELRRVQSWVDAARARVLGELTAKGALSTLTAVLADDNASSAETARRKNSATVIAMAPEFGLALASGDVTVEHVAAVARVRNKASVPGAATGLLAQARNVTPEEFRRRLAEWDDALDADNGASGAKRRRAKRSLSFHNTDDGMGVTRLALPNAEHALVFDAVQHMADELWRHSGDRASSPQQRSADAIVELIARGMGVARMPSDGGTPAEHHDSGDRATMRPKPVEPTLVVFVDETDLRDGTGSGVTANGSSLSISEVRRLACAAGIIPVVMSGAGRVLDVGRTQRTCTDAQWWALALRDRGCVVKGCQANVWFCEAHHAREWEHGGPTNLANMGLLCHHHHTVLHHDRWTMSVHEGKCRIIDAEGSSIETVDPLPPRRRSRRC